MTRRRSYPPQDEAARAARRQMIAAMYQQGFSLRQIAVRLNLSWQAVHATLQRLGVPRRSRGGNQGGHSRHAGG